MKHIVALALALAVTPARVAASVASDITKGALLGAIRQANRERILAAANGVFARAGFAAATTAAIAKAAGLPKANVHYDFGSKQ